MKGVLVSCGILFFGFFSFSEAASLYMDPNTAELFRGDTLKVSVRLDTDEGECVNVVDGVISYPENIFPVDVSRGASIMSVWVEEPVINRSERTISFAGGIPNGYCGRIAGDPRLTNVIIDLLFQSPGFVIGADPSQNTAPLTFTEQTKVLLNDGFGTSAPLSMFGASITLAKGAGDRIENQWTAIINADDIQPEEFSITLERTSNAYSNKYFIVFNTTDKQSGIDHYEVIEESMEEARLFNWGRTDAPWAKVRSPYVLGDQSLHSTIRVRAIDKAGNEYVATLVPDENQRTITFEVKVMLSLLAFASLTIIIGLFVYLYYRRKDSEVQVTDSSSAIT